MSIRCPTCDTENAENSAFCIECGAPLRAIAVGSTERLPQAADGKHCPFCATLNPTQARFCVNCGRSLDATMPAVATVAAPIYTPPAEPAPLIAPNRFRTGRFRTGRFSGQNGAVWASASGGVFLIGLAILFVTGTIWPGILALLGAMSLLGGFFGGREYHGFAGAVWLIGLAVLFATDTIWPGVLVLAGISAILGAMFGSFRGRSRSN